MYNPRTISTSLFFSFEHEGMLCFDPFHFLLLFLHVLLRKLITGATESRHMWTRAYKHTHLKGHIKEGRFIVVSFPSVNMSGSYEWVP